MGRKLDLEKITKIGMRVMKRMNIPLYWSKFSRKDYTIHQHIMMIVLAQYAGNVEKMFQMLRKCHSLGINEHLRCEHILLCRAMTTFF